LKILLPYKCVVTLMKEERNKEGKVHAKEKQGMMQSKRKII
jgi:hypothetical protein